MSKRNERQLSLSLGIPDDRKRKIADEEPKRLEAAKAEVSCLSEARRVREKNESSRYFREIVKLARHF